MDYDFSKLKVAKGTLKTVPAENLLPPSAARYLRENRTLIEHTAGELEQDRLDGSLIQPYWDTTLRGSRAARRELYEALQQDESLEVGILDRKFVALALAVRWARARTGERIFFLRQHSTSEVSPLL